MNTEYRNKLFNRIKDVFEKEETQEQQAFMQSREDFNELQKSTFELAKEVVERSYPKEDVDTLRVFKKKYGDPCDVVAKDKCFYFSHSEDVDDEGEKIDTSSHLNIISKVESDFSKNWLRRYNKGIRFEFYPPN